MSPPRPDWAIRGRANVFAKDAPSPSAADARADWFVVADAIEEAGGVVVVVDNAVDPLLTGLPYTAEAGLCCGSTFILPNLTPPHRQGEPRIVGPAVARLGLQGVTLPEAVRFEGQGDVIRVGDRVVVTHGVGPWARSNAAAFDAISAFLPWPARSLRFHADPWFHGNTFLGAFTHNEQTMVVVCAEAFVDDDFAKMLAFIGDVRVIKITKEETLTYATQRTAGQRDRARA